MCLLSTPHLIQAPAQQNPILSSIKNFSAPIHLKARRLFSLFYFRSIRFFSVGVIFSPHTQNRCCRAQLCSPPEQNTSESFSQILIDRQGDYQVKIIIRCRLVSAQCTAAGAAMRYDIALFRVRLGKHRFKRCAALGRAIARIFVNMERPEAVWAMISRGVAERRDLSAAMLTDKSAVVL